MSAPPKGAGARRIAVVTGGAGAIGGAIVAALRTDGHRVVVLDRDAEISADLGSAAATSSFTPRRHSISRPWPTSTPRPGACPGGQRRVRTLAGPGIHARHG